MRAQAFAGAITALVCVVGGASAGSYAPPPGDGFPVWAPDGQRIAFLTGRGAPALVVRPLGSSAEGRIMDVAGVGWYPDPTSVALSPDWQWVATTRSLRLIAVRTDGTAERDLASVSYGATPAWSPDSSRIAFRAADGAIVAMRIDGRGLTTLAPGGTSLAWSPDGTRVAYAGGAPANLDVHVVDSDGSDDAVVAGGSGAQLEPKWSPDGTRIAFLTQAATGEPFALAVARPDGTELRTYPGPGVSNSGSFAWIPDGQALVFANGATQGFSTSTLRRAARGG